MIHVRSAHFRNFRTLRDTFIPLRSTTVIVGPNNAGKTSVLEGLANALGVGRRVYAFDERDVSVGVEPTEGFEILVEFGPATGAAFSDDEVALFSNHVDFVDGQDRVFVAVVGKVETEDEVFRTRLKFRKSDGGDDGVVSAVERAALGFLLLPAVRDARHELADRGGLWSQLARDIELTDAGKASLESLGETGGRQVVEGLLGPSRAQEVTDAITGLISSVLFADVAQPSLSFSLLPEDVRQALRSVEMRMQSPDEQTARRVSSQSVGTQSVAMFGLFSAYARGWGERVVALGIEEPESHLHPHAVRSVVRSLDGLAAQVLVTTHSTAVTDSTDPRDIVRLRRRGSQTTAHSATELAESEARSIKKHILDAGSDFVFARAILLAEGDSERLAIPRFASQLGYDFDTLGISVVPVLGSTFGPMAKLLGPSGLSIPFAMLCDKDAAKQLLRVAIALGRMPDTPENRDPVTAAVVAQAAGTFWWQVSDFEQVLLDGGAGPFYVDAVAEFYGNRYLHRFAASKGVPEPADPGTDLPFLRQVLRARVSKPLLAERVAERFYETTTPVPPGIAEVIHHVAALAVDEARLATGAVVSAATAT